MFAPTEAYVHTVALADLKATRKLLSFVALSVHVTWMLEPVTVPTRRPVGAAGTVAGDDVGLGVGVAVGDDVAAGVGVGEAPPPLSSKPPK